MSYSKKRLLEQIAMYSDESFHIFEGKSHVMLSAPHFAEQTRNNETKYSEPSSGLLAVASCFSTQCHSIVKMKNCGDDANFDKNCAYKSALVEYVKKKQISVLFDLHQMSPKRDTLICLGTGYGANMFGFNNIVAMAVKYFLNIGVNLISINDPFAASYENTVSSTVARECGIPCMQIEINTRLLSEEYDDECFNSVLSVINKLSRLYKDFTVEY